MINIADEQYIKLLSIRMFLDENFFDFADPLDLKKSLEEIGLFSSGDLSRALVFRLDGRPSKGGSASRATHAKIKEAIASKNVATLRFMDDENLELDNQNYLEINSDQYGSGFGSQIHILASRVEKFKECQIAVADCISRFNPQYAFASIYVLDHFGGEVATGRAVIDEINEQHPIDSMNINRYQGLAKEGKIKDAQWINYFSKRYLSHIVLPNPDFLAKINHTDLGTYVQISDAPYFSEKNIDWVRSFRAANSEHIVLR